jgi:hypothetical protein
MINVKHKRCREIGCQKQPIFNVAGILQGLYCAEHKQPGMVDVKNKRCEQCQTKAWYGCPGLAPTRCAQHRDINMIPHPRRKCEYDKCPETATYGVKSCPERCEAHKQRTDRDLVLHRCAACTEPAVVNAEQMCQNCDHRGHNIRLARQKQVKAAIDASGLPTYKIYDNIAFDDTRCGRERPDFLWDCGTHHVILDVDEDQHKTRPCECEQTRMVNITQGLGMPCLWVRYNPDDYKGQTAAIRDRHRLEYLVKFLQGRLNDAPQDNTQFLRVCHLFFDDFKITNPPRMDVIPCI